MTFRPAHSAVLRLRALLAVAAILVAAPRPAAASYRLRQELVAHSGALSEDLGGVTATSGGSTAGNSAQDRDAAAACLAKYLSAGQFSGKVAFPGSKDYADTLLVDNQSAAQGYSPVLSAFPTSTGDVVSALTAARECGSPLSVKSGGHSAGAYALSNGLVVDLRDFARITLVGTEQQPTVEVQGGARWKAVYAAVKDTGLVPIGGGCPFVGVSGFLMGGGWSFLSRSYGLGIDNVVSVELVLANSTVVTASATENPELFWALRGGGGGNFGIATSFVLRLHRPSPKVTAGQMCWAPFGDHVPDIFGMWLDRFTDMPRWLHLEPVWLPLGPVGAPSARVEAGYDEEGSPGMEGVDKRLFCFTVVCNESEGNCDRELQPFINRAPVLNSVDRRPFVEWQTGLGNATTVGTGRFYVKSGVLPMGALTKARVRDIMKVLQSSPSTSSLVLFHEGGGAISDHPSGATAFPHRDLQLIIQVKSVWASDNEHDKEASIAWANAVFGKVDDVLGGAYINYIDPLLEGWEENYYAGNYPRLQQIKKAADPTNLFHSHQSIRPTPSATQ